VHSWRELPGAPACGAALCRVADIPDGGAHELRFGSDEEPFRVLLIRRADAVWAYRNCCPHFSIPLNYEPGLFHVFDGEILMCAHHTAMFRVEDGYCYDGPCQGAKLDAIPLQRDGEIVRVA